MPLRGVALARKREEMLVLDPKDAYRSPAADERRRSARGPAAPRGLAVGLALAAGLVIGACSIPFGNGGDPSSQSPEDTRRDRNRRYIEEQGAYQRQQTFDRVGPPPDR
jgi:hypothetical protein